MLPSGQWQLRRHQGAEGGKCVIESVWYQAMRSDDLRCLSIGSGMNRHGIFNRIQLTLRFNGATNSFIILDRDGLYPSHVIYLISIVRAFPSSATVMVLETPGDLMTKLNFRAPVL